MKYFLGLILFALATSNAVYSQKQIKGKIVDAATGEPLAAAHVIIKDSYTGTIANSDGEYSLFIKEFPATIVVRFIGFETQEQIVDSDHEGILDFNMKEAVANLGEITITGEDPAISIMKEVIRRKQIWRAKLSTYRAEAYSRQQLLNDTSIVSISESVSEAYWDKERGPKEVLISRRQTANIEGADNFAGVSYLPNFYDDMLDIAEFDMVGVTNERALKYYNFKLVDYKSIDDKIVYEIEVSPKRKLQPLFEGTIYVLDEEFALLSVKLKPNQVVVFPPPVQDFNLYYEQQFSNFGGDFWLPVDVRIEGLVKVGVVGLRFPPIGFSQISKLNNYEINVEVPDSLYESGYLFSVDSTTINKPDSIFSTTIDAVPLSEKETLAYTTLDSTATLEKAFKPTGFFARFIDFDDDDDSNVEVSSEGGSSSNSGRSVSTGKGKRNSFVRDFVGDLKYNARYNRVETFFGSLTHEKYYVKNRFRGSATIGYNLGYQELTHGVSFSWWPLKKTRRFGVTFGYLSDTRTSYDTEMYSRMMLSTLPLFGYDDYFDYYRNTSGFLRFAFRPRGKNTTYRMEYTYEDHSSIDFKTSYDVLGRDNTQRLNPPIEEGRLSSIRFNLTRGDLENTLGAIGANNLKINVEQSLKILGSDWNFTRFEIDINKRFNTFYKKRFIPNALDVRLNAGTYIGDLPIQENGAVDAALGYFSPFGALKSKRYTPYQGGSYAALYAEHNFRSVPFEMLGWRKAPKTGLSLIVFGGAGKTWNYNSSNILFNPQEPEDIHLEAGVSLSNIFSLFRFDLAYRVDNPGIYPGVSIARFF